MSGQYLIVRTRDAWIEQANKAIQAWQASSARTLEEFAKVDYEQFCLLVEALHALGQPVSKEMLDRAQMRPLTDD